MTSKTSNTLNQVHLLRYGKSSSSKSPYYMLLSKRGSNMEPLVGISLIISINPIWSWSENSFTTIICKKHRSDRINPEICSSMSLKTSVMAIRSLILWTDTCWTPSWVRYLVKMSLLMLDCLRSNSLHSKMALYKITWSISSQCHISSMRSIVGFIWIQISQKTKWRTSSILRRFFTYKVIINQSSHCLWSWSLLFMRGSSRGFPWNLTWKWLRRSSLYNCKRMSSTTIPFWDRKSNSIKLSYNSLGNHCKGYWMVFMGNSNCQNQMT